MAPNSAQKLDNIRSKIITDLGSMSAQLAGDDAISVDALIAIARTTGNPDLLEKALQKAEKIEDSSERADALLDLLDEVDTQLSEQTQASIETEGVSESSEISTPESPTTPAET